MHNPPNIPVSLAEPDVLRTGTYSDADLCLALTEYLRLQNNGQFTRRAERGIREFEANGVWPVRHPERISSMQQAFDILNLVFFNGYLTGLCELSMPDRPQDKPTCRGSTSTNYPNRGRPLIPGRTGLYCIIKVHPDMAYGPQGWQRADKYQSILIHEMLHAYFELYACRCDDGCKTAGRAWRGHPEHWFLAARAIERSRVNRREVPTRDGPLAFRLFFRMERIIAKALKKAAEDRRREQDFEVEVIIPPEAVLAELGMSTEGVRRQLGKIAEEDAIIAAASAATRTRRERRHRDHRPHGSGGMFGGFFGGSSRR